MTVTDSPWWRVSGRLRRSAGPGRSPACPPHRSGRGRSVPPLPPSPQQLLQPAAPPHSCREGGDVRHTSTNKHTNIYVLHTYPLLYLLVLYYKTGLISRLLFNIFFNYFQLILLNSNTQISIKLKIFFPLIELYVFFPLQID